MTAVAAAAAAASFSATAPAAAAAAAGSSPCQGGHRYAHCYCAQNRERRLQFV